MIKESEVIMVYFHDIYFIFVLLGIQLKMLIKFVRNLKIIK